LVCRSLLLFSPPALPTAGALQIDTPFYMVDYESGAECPMDPSVVDEAGAEADPFGRCLMLGVDILPSELPREASGHFADKLFDLLPTLASSDGTKPFAEQSEGAGGDLPDALYGATITNAGELTPNFSYIEVGVKGHFCAERTRGRARRGVRGEARRAASSRATLSALSYLTNPRGQPPTHPPNIARLPARFLTPFILCRLPSQGMRKANEREMGQSAMGPGTPTDVIDGSTVFSLAGHLFDSGLINQVPATGCHPSSAGCPMLVVWLLCLHLRSSSGMRSQGGPLTAGRALAPTPLPPPRPRAPCAPSSCKLFAQVLNLIEVEGGQFSIVEVKVGSNIGQVKGSESESIKGFVSTAHVQITMPQGAEALKSTLAKIETLCSVLPAAEAEMVELPKTYCSGDYTQTATGLMN
jgi:hypothetical protein